MSELTILKSLVLAQQEALSHLREENNQIKNENKRLKAYACDCRNVSWYCGDCETGLCETCETLCVRCDKSFCKTCSEKQFKLTCNLCQGQIIVCQNCWEEDLSFHCFYYTNGHACNGILQV